MYHNHELWGSEIGSETHAVSCSSLRKLKPCHTCDGCHHQAGDVPERMRALAAATNRSEFWQREGNQPFGPQIGVSSSGAPPSGAPPSGDSLMAQNPAMFQASVTAADLAKCDRPPNIPGP